MIDLKSISTDVKPLILQAGDIILEAWNNNTVVSHLKDERDIVTETDTEVEEYLRKYLYKVLPQAGFVVEEGKTEMLGEFNWTIDPIDGTKYFATHTPLFFTQVALLRNNKPVICFIYNPISKQLFHAIEGCGSYVNDIKIEKREESTLSNSIIDFDFGSTEGAKNTWKYSLFQKIAQKSYRIRATAGYLAPYLALGMIDAYINLDIKTPFSTKNITDLAPHKLLLSEAGYCEEIINIDSHSILVWASKQHIIELKSILHHPNP